MKNFNWVYKLSIFFILLSAFGQVNAQNVGISATVVAPDASAGLDVNFVGKGLLIPRINLLSPTDNTTILSPATSLLIYNTNATLGLGYYYNSSIPATPNWVKLAVGNVKKLASDVSSSNSWTNINDLSFAALAGVTYNFKAVIAFSQTVTRGTGWAVNGVTGVLPMTTSLLSYTTTWNINNNDAQFRYYLDNFNGGTQSTTSPNTGLAIIEGIITPSSTGTFYISFHGNVSPVSAVTAKAGSSLSYW